MVKMKNSIGRIISVLSRQIQSELKCVIEPFGITAGEEPYYMELVYENGLTQDELTSRVSVDKAATARAVKSLEDKGYLIRVLDEKDKRNKRLYLTEEAREKYKQIAEKLQEYNRLLTEELTDEEYETVYRCLQQISGNCKKRKVSNKN